MSNDDADTSPETVESTSDERVANNTMRHKYRFLDDGEKANMQALKDAGEQFLALMHHVGGTDLESEQMGSRELSIAKTKLEEAVMWSVKHVTR